MFSNDNTTAALSTVAIMMDRKSKGETCKYQAAAFACALEMDENGQPTGRAIIDFSDERVGKFEAPTDANPAGRVEVYAVGLSKVAAHLETMRAVYPDAEVNKSAAIIAGKRSEIEKIQKDMKKKADAMAVLMAEMEAELAALHGVADEVNG